MPQHNEDTLRLVLGSILSPKRPPYSRSTSQQVSGTVTPHPQPIQRTGSVTEHVESPLHHSQSAPPSPHLSVPTDGAGTGALTPNSRARFIEALQAKPSAWDALIHGSFS